MKHVTIYCKCGVVGCRRKLLITYFPDALKAVVKFHEDNAVESVVTLSIADLTSLLFDITKR